MQEMVTDCPRCGTLRMTFDVGFSHRIGFNYEWQSVFEAYAVCRHCRRGTIFILELTDATQWKIFHTPKIEQGGNLTQWFSVGGYVGIKDKHVADPPEHVPPAIRSAFAEAATCMSVSCWNAAAAMFRLCVDLATREWLPAPGVDAEGLNARVRRDLGL